ncbi:MAG: hypothetical protein O7E54_09710 [Planctomycetota bacterium]|nr:hypothetical protein [Planctomycetota bacterium]
MRGWILFAPALFLSIPSAAAPIERERPLYNVEIKDAAGVTTKVVAFYRLSSDDRFQGNHGAAQIEVPYERLREIRIRPPTHPGGQMRATLMLRSGKPVEATFDEREGEVLFAGFTEFGRVRVFFRNIRVLKFLGKTRPEDLPSFGRQVTGVDARVTDKHGFGTELVAFRRNVGENIFQGVRGSASIEIPLRIIRVLEIQPDERRGLLVATAHLKSGKKVRYTVPVYEERTLYYGKAEFGDFRVPLGGIRRLEVHRVTPKLRGLDPLAAAEGAPVEQKPGR